MTIPTIGRIVIFNCSSQAAQEINRRRKDAAEKMDWHRALKSGAQVHVGNSAEEGKKYPAMIVAVWGNTPECAANLKVMLDGTDTYWATSVSVGDKPGSFAWPVYVAPTPAATVTPQPDTPPSDAPTVAA